MAGVYRLKPWKDKCLLVLGRWLGRRGISANAVTFVGLIGGLTASVLLWNRLFAVSLIFLVLSVFSDLLDGTTARCNGQVSLVGKLFDAVSDRLVETSWVGALIAIDRLPGWGIFLPLGSVLLLWCRYWAHRKGEETSYVLVTRFERITVMAGVLLIPWQWLSYPLYLAVVIGTFTSAGWILVATNLKSHEPYYRKNAVDKYRRKTLLGSAKGSVWTR